MSFIYLEHEVRGNDADDPAALAGKGLNDIPDTLSQAVDQAQVSDVRLQIIRKHFGKVQGFGILGDKLRGDIRKHDTDKVFRQAARVLVQIQAKVVLPLVPVKDSVKVSSFGFR